MKLKATKRETTGSTSARAARSAEKIPCVIYRRGQESIPVLIDKKEMTDLVRKQGQNAVIDIEIEGGETVQVIIKEVSRAALKPEIYSVELQAFEKGQTMTFNISIHLVGANDVIDGVVTQTLNELEIETTPDNIPNEFSVQVKKEMAIGETITVSELTIPEGVKVVTDPETPVAVVSAPVEEEAQPEAGAEAAEPGLVGGEKE